MEVKDVIKKVKESVKLEDIFPDLRKGVVDSRSLLASIHPDRCKLDGAEEAFKKVSEWLQEWKKGGKEFKDESGAFKFNGYEAIYDGKENTAILVWSAENHKQMLKRYPEHFHKYIPNDVYMETTGECKAQFKDRAICLSGLELEQKHVNWVLSRMLEFCVMLHDEGRVHAGLNPESVFLVPETHGIVVGSFYHLSERGKKVGTINGKYKDWYPSELFSNKLATERIDLELVKKIAIYLLGDRSGVGTRLRGKVNENFLNFVLKGHSNSLEAYKEYRDMLSKNFKQEFHILNI